MHCFTERAWDRDRVCLDMHFSHSKLLVRTAVFCGHGWHFLRTLSTNFFQMYRTYLSCETKKVPYMVGNSHALKETNIDRSKRTRLTKHLGGRCAVHVLRSAPYSPVSGLESDRRLWPPAQCSRVIAQFFITRFVYWLGVDLFPSGSGTHRPAL